MSVNIQLDLAALNALFPEGSEARVNLSRAVAASLCERLAIKETKHLADEHKTALQKVVKETLTNMGMGTGWQGVVVIEDRVRRAIQEETQKDVKAVISTEIATAIHEQKGALNDRIEEIFTRRIDEAMGIKLRELVRSAVRDVLGKL